jgi:superfamily II DNA or RNA helicase
MSKLVPGGGYDDAEAWNRRYGVNTTAAAEALKREVSPYIYAAHIKMPNKVIRSRETVSLGDKQRAAYDGVRGAFEKLRAARLSGTVDVDAAKVLAPKRFEGVPEDQQENVAKQVMKVAGSLRDSRLQDVVDSSDPDENAKIQKLTEIAKRENRDEKPLVVFAHRLDAVRKIAAHLKAQGYTTETYMGPDSQIERAKKRRAFQAGKTQALVLSDAGEAGLNLQQGHTLVQYDRPYTAKTHAQRFGRIDRLGQKHPEIHLIDLQTDTPFEARAQHRVEKKYDLRNILTDPAEMLDDTGISGMLKQARAEHATRAAAKAKVDPGPPPPRQAFPGLLTSSRREREQPPMQGA